MPRISDVASSRRARGSCDGWCNILLPFADGDAIRRALQRTGILRRDRARAHLRPCFFIPGTPEARCAGTGSLEPALNNPAMSALRSAIRAGERPECTTCVCPLWRDDRGGLNPAARARDACAEPNYGRIDRKCPFGGLRTLGAELIRTCPRNPLMRAEQRLMLRHWPAVTGRRALDLACGSGRYSQPVA